MLVIVKTLSLAYLHERDMLLSELEELQTAIDRTLEAFTS
jgi:hypothetical protein